MVRPLGGDQGIEARPARLRKFWRIHPDHSAGNETLLVVSLDAQFGENKGQIHIAVPFAAVEPLIRRLCQSSEAPANPVTRRGRRRACLALECLLQRRASAGDRGMGRPGNDHHGFLRLEGGRRSSTDRPGHSRSMCGWPTLSDFKAAPAHGRAMGGRVNPSH